jgi:hypothetical protein
MLFIFKDYNLTLTPNKNDVDDGNVPLSTRLDTSGSKPV